MPIYAYRCSACGHAQDVLQKLSDPVLTTCPHCGAETFGKQVTAAGFQLKGSGWYVTDFRGGGSAASAKPAEGAASGDAKPAEPGASAAPADKPAADKPAASATPST
jgi:putative FmdB family regulatory protein